MLEFKFANCVTEAINHYLELFKKDFEKYLAEPAIAYVMTNNIQAGCKPLALSARNSII